MGDSYGIYMYMCMCMYVYVYVFVLYVCVLSRIIYRLKNVTLNANEICNIHWLFKIT